MKEITIDCPRCAVRIKASVSGWVRSESEENFVLVQCHSCNGPLFGIVFEYMDEFNDEQWTTADRLWPPPSVNISISIPEEARRDIMDAQKCILHGIYSAAAVMCGRALERLIEEKIGAQTISKGLTGLKSRGVIDQRLFDWAEILRKERNIGAHASEESLKKEDAQDVVDFTVAIFDYVYTLSEKYESYVSRKRHLLPPPKNS